MKKIVAVALLTLLAACAGRDEPQGSFLDPVCMRDGSVAFRQLASSDGTYGEPIAKKEYCPWNKPAAK